MRKSLVFLWLFLESERKKIDTCSCKAEQYTVWRTSMVASRLSSQLLAPTAGNATNTRVDQVLGSPPEELTWKWTPRMTIPKMRSISSAVRRRKTSNSGLAFGRWQKVVERTQELFRQTGCWRWRCVRRSCLLTSMSFEKQHDWNSSPCTVMLGI